MNNKFNYPFICQIDNNIYIHIEHLDENISCVWFDNIVNVEQKIPNEIKIYNSNDKLLNPYRNTQSFALSRGKNYKIKYNDKTIIILETLMLLCNPPKIQEEILVIN